MAAENAHSAVYYAAWALNAGAEDAAVAASVCKSYVSDAARHVAGDAIQVHGGIGFTWEYDLHLYFKRAKGLEPLFGDEHTHTSRAGAELNAEIVVTLLQGLKKNPLAPYLAEKAH